MKQVVPEVKASETIHHLLKLLRRVESLQAVGLNNLLQLGHQPLLRCSIATYRVAGIVIGDIDNYSRHCPLQVQPPESEQQCRHRCIDSVKTSQLSMSGRASLCIASLNICCMQCYDA